MHPLGWIFLGTAAWLAATFCAPLIALLFRLRLTQLLGWARHLLFGPVVCACEWISIDLIFFAAHDDGSGPPGLGFVLIFPVAVFLGTIVTYYAVATYAAARSLCRSAHVR